LDARVLVESVACRDCDLLQKIPTLGPGGGAVCVRCARVLVKVPPGSPDRALALSVAAAISLVVANTFPLMELHVVGRFATATIAGGAYQMWMQGERITSVLVAFCALIAPAGYLVFMMTLLIAARCSPIPGWTGEMLRWVGHLQVWSMLEVVMLGILVALIKIAQLASVDPGIGMYAFGTTVLLIPAVMLSFDRWDIWRRIAWIDAEVREAPVLPGYRSAGAQG
jgi:paraquat-inducible protein A